MYTGFSVSAEIQETSTMRKLKNLIVNKRYLMLFLHFKLSFMLGTYDRRKVPPQFVPGSHDKYRSRYRVLSKVGYRNG